jgi:hypothetical protein
MSSATKIEWTQSDDGAAGATWNPVTGCTKVSVRAAGRDLPSDATACQACGGPVKSPGLPVCNRCVKGALGITYRHLDHWSRQGYLRPGRREAGARQSSGSFRAWTSGELKIAALTGRLVHAGLTPAAAANAARAEGGRCEVAPGIWIEVTP